MPLYECECKTCGAHDDYYQTVANRRNTPTCKCGGATRFVFCTPYVQPDIEPYVSTTTGRIIGSRTIRRDDLRRSNCREWEGLSAEKAEAQRRVAYAEQKSEASLDRAARQAYYQLPPEKRRILENR